MIVGSIVQQHADDAAALATNRLALAQAAYPNLARLRRADSRLRANLDGVRIAGDEGSRLCAAALDGPLPGAAFPVTVGALEARNWSRLEQAIALTQAVPRLLDGLLYAFEWTERSQLQGVVAGLLRDRDQFRRVLGMSACGAHRVDPGILNRAYLRDADPAIRACAFRVVGELGLVDRLSPTVEALRHDDDAEVQFWTAWSAVLLGDRGAALDRLIEHGRSVGPHRSRSFRLALQTMTPSATHTLLKQLAREGQQSRWLIQGTGLSGDPLYVPWLIRQMADPKMARAAGEAFALVTGADLPHDALDCPAPEAFESGPSDDPDDSNLDIDLDDGLTWPDVDKIEKWWSANASRFQNGGRYFVGAAVTREHCFNVLKSGYQRQRILAAHYLVLMEPGTPLFNTSAPAWRQERLLAKMHELRGAAPESTRAALIAG